MEDITFRDRFRYTVDNIFSKGTAALILWLAILSLIVILIAAAFVTLTGAHMEGEETVSFLEAAWRSMMRTLDAGTMGGDTGWGFRLIMFGVTVGGVFVISTLIGVLTTAVEGKLEELRKGRSRVIESGHTIILGWSEQIFAIISELAAANQNQPRSSIVILGEKDKVEMEDEIRDKISATGRTRIVCRSGSPMEMEHLSIVSLNSAKSIIVLSPDQEEGADAGVIKTVLAITNHPNRHAGPFHIVAELRDPKNDEIARVIGKDEVEWIQVGNLVARIIAQTCRQSGLSVIYTELLDFGGDEIYFSAQVALEGRTYAEALKCFEKNAVMGISDGKIAALNPPMSTILKPGEQLILIAADDDKIFYNPAPQAFQPAAIIEADAAAPAPEKTLILGWNWRGLTILSELDNYVAHGSEVVIVASQEDVERTIRHHARLLHNQKVAFVEGDTTDRTTLDGLELSRFDHIILLSYSDTLTTQQADSRTLIALLHLRDISDKTGTDFSIVSEMLDVRNRNLAEVTRADDFIVSDKLVSLMLSQVSENKGLNAVFTDMFDPEGSEIYLKPAAQYVKTGQALNFYTVLEAAARRGETAIGYRLVKFSHDASRAYGVTLNPAKSEAVTFEPDDKIVVLAND
jgi:voltage-gated potassium channel Kch